MNVFVNSIDIDIESTKIAGYLKYLEFYLARNITRILESGQNNFISGCLGLCDGWGSYNPSCST